MRALYLNHINLHICIVSINMFVLINMIKFMVEKPFCSHWTEHQSQWNLAFTWMILDASAIVHIKICCIQINVTAIKYSKYWLYRHAKKKLISWPKNDVNAILSLKTENLTRTIIRTKRNQKVSMGTREIWLEIQM